MFTSYQSQLTQPQTSHHINHNFTQPEMFTSYQSQLTQPQTFTSYQSQLTQPQTSYQSQLTQPQTFTSYQSQLTDPLFTDPQAFNSCPFTESQAFTADADTTLSSLGQYYSSMYSFTQL